MSVEARSALEPARLRSAARPLSHPWSGITSGPTPPSPVRRPTLQCRGRPSAALTDPSRGRATVDARLQSSSTRSATGGRSVGQSVPIYRPGRVPSAASLSAASRDLPCADGRSPADERAVLDAVRPAGCAVALAARTGEGHGRRSGDDPRDRGPAAEARSCLLREGPGGRAQGPLRRDGGRVGCPDGDDSAGGRDFRGDVRHTEPGGADGPHVRPREDDWRGCAGLARAARAGEPAGGAS